MTSGFLGGDEVGAVVIDVGSSSTKVGYAGDDQPRTIFPSAVGITYESDQSNVGETGTIGEDPMDVDMQSKKKKFHVGTEELSYRRDHMEVHWALEEGLVKDWDVLESLWGFGLSNRLHVDPKEHPLLMVEPAFNTRQNREKLTELVFEKYEAPALFVSKDAVLSCFSAGRATGLVLDSGGGKTSAVPVYDGYALQQAIVRSHVAGSRLDAELCRTLQAKFPDSPILPPYQTSKKDVGGGKIKVTVHEFPNTHPSYAEYRIKELVTDIRHSVCAVSPSSFDLQQNQTMPTAPYELPDGKLLEIGPERYLIPEILFAPQHLSKMDIDGDRPVFGVQQMVMDSINACDVDIRRELCSGVLVTGGNTLYTGFVDRLNNELGNSVAQKIKVISSNIATERRCGAWIGGSILGSLGTFQQMWMSKAEYEERGKSLVERKCP